LIVVAQTSVVVSNLYTGIAWFILPAMLVITNDIFAYVFGKLFGKTKLIELSPNKTWEGFIGGFFSSLFFAFLVSNNDFLIFGLISTLKKDQILIEICLFVFESSHICSRCSRALSVLIKSTKSSHSSSKTAQSLRYFSYNNIPYLIGSPASQALDMFHSQDSRSIRLF